MIPLPSPIPRARGVHSTNQLGSNIKTRITTDERKLLEEVAGDLGISSFVRWCAIHAALAIKKKIGEDYDTSNRDILND